MTENGGRVLIVDDEEDICAILSRLMKREGLKALVAHDAEAALKMIRPRSSDVMLVGIKVWGLDGVEVMRRAKKLDADLPVVTITYHAARDAAIEAMRAGAHDYLAKPFNNHEVVSVVRRALAERELRRKIKGLFSQIQQGRRLREMMGPSQSVGWLISEVNRAAKSDSTVLILGETGAGKELVAHAIHQASRRSAAPFLPVDCVAISETLLESELFGHEKGAFTGAEIQNSGKLEVAQGGTLFLDDISNMPLGSQAKLLRLLREKKVYRVGGTKPVDVDVRVLVASSEDLRRLSVSGSFRRDLFFHLSGFSITVPPLRERKDDIPSLAKRFLDTTNMELGKSVKGFLESAVDALLAYAWPGNVQQLRSTIRRAVLLADDMITEKHLAINTAPAAGSAFSPKALWTRSSGLSLNEIVQRNTAAVEREALVQALNYTGGNNAKAARLLKIDYKTIHTKTKKYGIAAKAGKRQKGER